MARMLFGDQLGPHFTDDAEDVVLVEAADELTRRPIHRQRAHLFLSAIRHRAAELDVPVHRAESFREALQDKGPLEAVGPTSWAARELADELGWSVLPSRGFVTSEQDFAGWVDGRRRLVMQDFYREVRAREGILMKGPDDPAGGRWNFDHDNREPAPKGHSTLGLPAPWQPQEDEIDEQVRADLDTMAADGVEFLGRDGPRAFAATRTEALEALQDFVAHRLPAFGPHEDAVLTEDPTMAHSLLSVPMNLGLLHPREVVEAVVTAHERDEAPIASVEGMVRQVIGWREWVWHLYWHLGPDYTTSNNHLDAHEPLPAAYWALDGEDVEAACLSHALGRLGEGGWLHHIQRLMVLGNFSLQRGHDPVELTRWFTDAFVDGTEWVMPANVVGMSQHADGGIVATKPYAAGGAYLNRMTDHCGSCAFNPRVRLGEDACPFTAGYWAFLDRVESRIRANHRMKQPLAGLARLADREDVVEQERNREHW
ncbi:cryptochrome/photolyase family protein [Aeromicrobium sp. CF4.19]|uniref:cryptochrome/photolyase family protein n=1 Tax=Aeromicrobium sp. CF4.19 TaxID=3373082 RepID=UPI003EE7C449